MPLSASMPYGIRDIKVRAFTTAANTALAAAVDLPYARTLSFSEAEEFEELRGDDKKVAIRGSGSWVDWEIESGGLSFEAMAIMFGGTVTESGTTPAIKKNWIKKSTDTRPYFQVEGQAISDSGGDVHCILERCRATGELEGEFSDGEFWLSTGSGEALAGLRTGREDVIYEFIQNETATAIVTAAIP